MRHGGPGPFLRTQAVCRAQAISSQGQALLLRGPTWASRRERERGRLNQHRLGKLRSGAPQRWPLAITDTCPPPTRPPGSSIWGSLPGLVGAVISTLPLTTAVVPGEVMAPGTKGGEAPRPPQPCRQDPLVTLLPHTTLTPGSGSHRTQES